MTFLVVTNNGTQTFSGPSARYDGRDYEFLPGAPTTISIDAARHIFGLGLGDKTPLLIKHGWMMSSNDVEKAMQKLNSFSFSSPEEYQAAQAAPAPEIVAAVTEAVQEQGTAPLQTGSAAEPVVSDGAPAEAARPTTIEPARHSEGVLTPARGSMLDKLRSLTGK